jgi:hypothetical protein
VVRLDSLFATRCGAPVAWPAPAAVGADAARAEAVSGAIQRTLDRAVETVDAYRQSPRAEELKRKIEQAKGRLFSVE